MQRRGRQQRALARARAHPRPPGPQPSARRDGKRTEPGRSPRSPEADSGTPTPRATGGAGTGGGKSDRPILPWKRGKASWREGADEPAYRRAAHGGHSEAQPHVPVVSGDSTHSVGELVRRARCGKSARRVPWGGAGVTRRPTRPNRTSCGLRPPQVFAVRAATRFRSVSASSGRHAASRAGTGKGTRASPASR